HGPVVAEAEQRGRVDLEMQVRRGAFRVSAVADVGDHLTGANACAVASRPCVAIEMRVVELVARSVAQPQAAAAEPLPTHGEEHAAGNREHRHAARREEVVAVVPRHAIARGSECVRDGDLLRKGEDVSAGVERRRLLQRRVQAHGADRSDHRGERTADAAPPRETHRQTDGHGARRAHDAYRRPTLPLSPRLDRVRRGHGADGCHDGESDDVDAECAGLRPLHRATPYRLARSALLAGYAWTSLAITWCDDWRDWS